MFRTPATHAKFPYAFWLDAGQSWPLEPMNIPHTVTTVWKISYFPKNIYPETLSFKVMLRETISYDSQRRF